MPTMLSETEVAPDFTLLGNAGQPIRLSDLRGRRVVLFFYPRADTPGCTVEACEFRDRGDEFDAQGAVILGISPDPVGDIRAFREKFQLPYRLLADPDHEIAQLYGVWKEKSMYGRTFWGVERTTFVIDEQGRITKVFRKVKPRGHAGEVLEGL